MNVFRFCTYTVPILTFMSVKIAITTSKKHYISRRSFFRQSAALSLGAYLAKFGSPLKDVIIGHGDFRYKVDREIPCVLYSWHFHVAGPVVDFRWTFGELLCLGSLTAYAVTSLL